MLQAIFLTNCILLLTGTAGMLNWVVAIAPDTLKSRYQTGMYYVVYFKSIQIFKI